jgi:hypothetical protein
MLHSRMAVTTRSTFSTYDTTRKRIHLIGSIRFPEWSDWVSCLALVSFSICCLRKPNILKRFFVYVNNFQGQNFAHFQDLEFLVAEYLKTLKQSFFPCEDQWDHSPYFLKVIFSKVRVSLLEVVISPCINLSGRGRTNACAMIPVEKQFGYNT